MAEPKKADKFIETISGEQADDEAIEPGTLKEGNLARPANKLLTRFHVVTKDGTTHAFMYHQLDSNATFKGSEFTLLFAGAKHWQITVKGSGPKFWKVFDYICLHRWPFIVEATRDFGGDTDTVFTEIEIKDVTPKSA